MALRRCQLRQPIHVGSRQRACEVDSGRVFVSRILLGRRPGIGGSAASRVTSRAERTADPGALRPKAMMRAPSPAPPKWHWPMLLLVPVALTLAVPDWMYSQTAFIDAWVYHGFFRHLETYT